MDDRFPPWRAALLLLAGAAAVLALALHGPIPQPASYHAFADQRTLLGIPHFWNVVSSLPFSVLGLAGLRRLRSRPPGLLPGLKACYAACFAGAVGIGLGSGWYHLRPDNASLVWDRLPMTVAFMGLFTAVLGEHIGTRLARRALPGLLLAGVGSVAYWVLSERLGTSDLRPYLLVQFLPMALVPLILLLYPSRLTGVGWLWALLGLYAVAKLLEGLDAALFEHLGLIGGHALKHLVAAGALGCLVLALRKRQPLRDSEDRGQRPLTRSRPPLSADPRP